MTDEKSPTSEEYQIQIDAFGKEREHHYKTFASALKRVLEEAARVSIPGAVVQARAKDVASFAEKFVRKYDKYPDAVNQMTDLCGARMIVQTLEQVKAVQMFIEHNFKILEKDDKGLSLSESAFGYRDVHYLVRLKRGRAEIIGFTPKECDAIGERTAEVQVRTWVQHAWADTLHDRMYKAPLRLSSEARRTGALLAAIMEDGDRSFDRLASELDGMTANYSAYAGREDVQKEIGVQELILANEADPNRKPLLSLRVSRLAAPGGDYNKVVELLDPYNEIQGPIRHELLLELGYALCKVHREKPTSPEYRRGQRYLEEVIQHAAQPDLDAIPDLRRQTSLHARALSRHAWSKEAEPGKEYEALKEYRQAAMVESENPYHLANQLGFEIFCQRNASVIDSMRTIILGGIETCRGHALAGTELPYAYLTAGRLNLLLGEAYTALSWYARSLHHLLNESPCVPPDLLDEEMRWLQRICLGHEVPKEHLWVRSLIGIAQSLQKKCGDVPAAEVSGEKMETPKVLIIAGGAASINKADLPKFKAMLTAALEDFSGIVISGGTTSGMPGCVGEVAGRLKAEGRKRFELVGYIPRHLPNDAPKDGHYDRFVDAGEEGSFSSEQILKNWEDLLGQGIDPGQVLLLGFGGGKISAIEYRIALGLGATVAILEGSGGEADELIKNSIWAGLENLFPIPFDLASVRAYVSPATQKFDYGKLEEMAKSFHRHYVSVSSARLPRNMRPWPDLENTFKKANYEQAKYAVEILKAAGFGVRPVEEGQAVIFKGFTQEEIECMAALEHGRWNIDRLRDGWRPGKERDDSRKIHDCLLPWKKLPDDIKEYDRVAVSASPKILAKANLEIYRLPDQKERLKRIKALMDIALPDEFLTG